MCYEISSASFENLSDPSLLCRTDPRSIIFFFFLYFPSSGLLEIQIEATSGNLRVGRSSWNCCLVSVSLDYSVELEILVWKYFKRGISTNAISTSVPLKTSIQIPEAFDHILVGGSFLVISPSGSPWVSQEDTGKRI